MKFFFSFEFFFRRKSKKYSTSRQQTLSSSLFRPSLFLSLSLPLSLFLSLPLNSLPSGGGGGKSKITSEPESNIKNFGNLLFSLFFRSPSGLSAPFVLLSLSLKGRKRANFFAPLSLSLEERKRANCYAPLSLSLKGRKGLKIFARSARFEGKRFFFPLRSLAKTTSNSLFLSQKKKLLTPVANASTRLVMPAPFPKYPL